MNYLSVCSGIEAATAAWHPLGWKPIAFSEIEKFPCAVLAHHYPTVPNFGDMTKFKEWPDVANLDVLVGGTPCQAFSVAGLRKGLADPRGNLTLTFLAVAARYRPRWVVWENVPGVFSDDSGAFGCFLGGLAELGYGWAYRVLDAQYFGVAQRRRRPFVVGYLGDWRRAGAVLFERASLSGHPAPSREAGKGIANSLVDRPDRGGGNSEGQRLVPHLAHSLRAQAQAQAQASHRADTETYVAHALRGDVFDASEDGTGRGTPIVPHVSPALKARDCKGPSSDGDGDGDGAILVPIAFDERNVTSPGADAGELAPTLRSMGHDGSHANAGGQVAVAFNARQDPDAWDQRTGPLDTDGGTQAVAFDNYNLRAGEDLAGTMSGCDAGNRVPQAMVAMRVRRLTPRECERLQGFLDDFTLVPYRGKPAADGPRYKALGNSMAVPVMRWIGERIAAVEAIKVAA